MNTSLSDPVDDVSEIYNQECKLLGLKIINYVTNLKNVKKYG